MRKLISFLPLLLLIVIAAGCSCEGIAKKAAKKATAVGLSAVEGVAEAVNEKGDKVAEKMTDAAGAVAEGAGRSLERQLDEHAAHVFEVAGRTLVQGAEGLDKGVCNEYYDVLKSENNLCSGVSLDYFAIIKNKAVVDAYFIILEGGKYDFKFEFGDCKTVQYTKTASADVTDMVRKYTVVSIALNADEETIVRNASCIKVTATKK